MYFGLPVCYIIVMLNIFTQGCLHVCDSPFFKVEINANKRNIRKGMTYFYDPFYCASIIVHYVVLGLFVFWVPFRICNA